MGTSTDAILWYGVTLDDDEHVPWDDPDFDGDAEDWLADLAGFREEFPYGDDSRYRAYFRAKAEAIKSTGVVLVHHCHLEYPMWGIAVQGTVTEAYRGSPMRIGELRVPEDAERTVSEFCERAGIPREACGETGWWVASYWG